MDILFTLNLTSQNIYSTLMSGLRIFAGPSIHHLHVPGNVISATVGFVYNNLQPQYELPSSTRFGQFQKFGKYELGAPSSQVTPRTKFCTGSEFLFIATCESDLIF